MKTLAKYVDTSEMMDGTFSKPRYKMSGESFISIESELSKFQRKEKVKSFITTTTTSVLGLGFLSYVLAAGSLGTLALPEFKIVSYPVFSSEMQDGYVTQAGTTIYASTVNEAPTSGFSGAATRVILAFTGAEEGITGKVLTTDTLTKITIQPNNTITYTENGATLTTQGTYAGELSGEYTLREEYLIECVSGACEQGEIIILPEKNVIGVVR